MGYLIEKVSGQSYADCLQQNLFTPLGMKDSGYDSNSAIILRRASGYTPVKASMANESYVNMTLPYAAGALYWTPGDLLQWERALFGGKSLSASSLKEMITPVRENYAFGRFISSPKGHEKIDHGGGIDGFNTELAYWPDDQLTVIVLANVNGNAPEEIARELASEVHGEKVKLTSERKKMKLAPEGSPVDNS